MLQHDFIKSINYNCIFLLEQSIKISIHEYLTTTLSLKYHEKITDDIQEALGDLPLHECIAML